jgi:hypothetical protein
MRGDPDRKNFIVYCNIIHKILQLSMQKKSTFLTLTNLKLII